MVYPFLSSLSISFLILTNTVAHALDEKISAKEFRLACQFDDVRLQDHDCVPLIERVLSKIKDDKNLCIPDDKRVALYVLSRTATQPSGPGWDAQTLIGHSAYSFWSC